MKFTSFKNKNTPAPVLGEIIDYKVIYGSQASNERLTPIAMLVRDAMKDGWEPLGPAQPIEINGFRLYQTLVKRA